MPHETGSTTSEKARATTRPSAHDGATGRIADVTRLSAALTEAVQILQGVDPQQFGRTREQWILDAEATLTACDRSSREREEATPPATEVLAIRDAATEVINAVCQRFFECLSDLPNRYADKHTIHRDAAKGAFKAARAELLQQVDVAILRTAAPPAASPSVADSGQGALLRALMLKWRHQDEPNSEVRDAVQQCADELDVVLRALRHQEGAPNV